MTKHINARNLNVLIITKKNYMEYATYINIIKYTTNAKYELWIAYILENKILVFLKVFDIYIYIYIERERDYFVSILSNFKNSVCFESILALIMYFVQYIVILNTVFGFVVFDCQ